MQTSLPATEPHVLLSRLSLLPDIISNSLRNQILSSEFRNATSFYHQVQILKQNEKITYSFLAILFNMKRSTLYFSVKKEKQLFERNNSLEIEQNTFAAPHSILTIKEEENLLNWIYARQNDFNCVTINEFCQEATKILRERDVNANSLTRTYWKSFKRRYVNVIQTKTILSRNSKRSSVTSEEVFEYFGQLVVALSEIKSLKQIINMDETGFHKRMQKARRRKCICFLNHNVEPRYSEESQSSQLSLVAAINMAGETLPAMFITKEKILQNNNEVNMILKYCYVTQSPKGYQNTYTMINWIENILKPYCQNVQLSLNDNNAKVFLIMDNCPSHNSNEIMNEFSKIENLKIIWLPSNSTHFLQQLDGNYFSVLKSYYNNGNTPTTKPKVAGKMIRAFKSFWCCSYPLTILKSWEMTGIRYYNIGTPNMSAAIDISLINKIVAANCPDFNLLETHEWNF